MYFTYGLGTLQSAASVLGLKVSEFVCVPFKSRVLVSYSSPGYKPCWFSKPDVMGAHFPGAGPQVWGAWCGAQTPLLRENLRVCEVPSHLWVAMLGVWVLMRPHLCPPPVSMCFFLYILSCRRAVLLVFRSFSKRAVAHVAVVLECPWEHLPTPPSGSHLSAPLHLYKSFHAHLSFYLLSDTFSFYAC